MPQTIAEINAEHAKSNGVSFFAEGRYAVASCTFKEARTGRKFAVIELRDGTGNLTARCFDEALLSGIDSAGAIDARLKVEEFNGAISCVVQSWDTAELSTDDVLELAGLDLDAHRKRVTILEGWLDECDNSVYGPVLRALFTESRTWDDFCMAPAAVRLHHAEPGGLVRHLVEVGKAGIGLLDSTGQEYDRALFLAGVFLHDIGKLDTYTMPPTIQYTAQGQMGEHQIWSTFRLAKACAIAGASSSLEARLLHIIEQAHGAYKHAEWQDALGVETKALAAADFFSSRLGITERERKTAELFDRIVELEGELADSQQTAGLF